MSQSLRDACFLLGLAAVVAGVGLLSVPWALIVGGGLVVSLSIWGTVHARDAARSK